MLPYDWSRTFITTKEEYSPADYKEFDAALNQARANRHPVCNWISADLPDFIYSFKVYKYYTQQESVYLAYKPTAPWLRLRYLSFSTDNIDSTTLSGLLTRNIRELMIEFYKNPSEFKGILFRDLFKNRDDPIFVKTISSIQRTLDGGNYRNFVNTKMTVTNGVLCWQISLKE